MFFGHAKIVFFDCNNHLLEAYMGIPKNTPQKEDSSLFFYHSSKTITILICVNKKSLDLCHKNDLNIYTACKPS